MTSKSFTPRESWKNISSSLSLSMPFTVAVWRQSSGIWNMLYSSAPCSTVCAASCRIAPALASLLYLDSRSLHSQQPGITTQYLIGAGRGVVYGIEREAKLEFLFAQEAVEVFLGIESIDFDLVWYFFGKVSITVVEDFGDFFLKAAGDVSPRKKLRSIDAIAR